MIVLYMYVLQISQWELICDYASSAPNTMSMYMAGVMAGSIVLGSLADRMGRKPTLLLAFLMMLVY